MDVLRGLFWMLATLLRGLWWLTVKGSRLSVRLIRWLLAQRRSTTFGSARWADAWDVLRGGAWGERGLIVGRFWGRFLRYHGDGALLVYAPQGSGKGVGIVVPNILDHKGSLIVTDPKGENAGVTARYRATLGPVYQLNVVEPLLSDQFNPLSMVRRGTLFEAEDTAMLADLLVMPESHDAHWDTAAKSLIAAVIGYVLRRFPPELQNLSTVRELLAADTEAFQHTLEDMVATGISTISEEAGNLLSAEGSPESLSIKNNAAKSLLIWSRDRIGGRLASRSDFDMLDLHRGVVTVYVIVPEDLLRVYAPFMRVMMGCAVVAMVRGKGFARPAHKPLLLFDECAALRRLDVLASGMGYLREYARTILVFQDLGQLQEHYGVDGARTFVAASGAQVAFDVNDNVTGRELSDTIGMTTVRASSNGLSQANTDLFRHQQQAGRSEAGRALRDPAEIRNLPRSRALVFLSTVRAPILARKVRYYQERRWHGLWDRWRDPATVTPLVQALPPPRSQAAA